MTMQKNLGFIIALVAGIVGLLAFFFLPFFSLFGFFSLTGQQVASLTSQGANSQNLGLYQGYQFLWALPIVAVVIILIALVPMFTRQGQSTARGEAIGLIALTALAIIGLIARYVIDSRPVSSSPSSITLSLASFYGAGFWAYAVAMIAALIGGILALRAPSQQPLSASPSQSWPPSQSWQEAQPWSTSSELMPPPPPSSPSEQVPPAETPPPPTSWQ